MGVQTLKGRNVKIEIGLTTATAKSVTAVSKASPGVATTAEHGLTAGTIGYFATSPGMSEIEGMALSVANPAAGTFELEKTNTTNFGTFTTSDFTPVASWATLGVVTTFELSGGEATKLDSTTLLDNMKQEDNGMLSAQSVTFGALVPAASHVAFDALDAAAMDGAFMVFRATFSNGYRVIFRGQPSLPSMSTQMDANVTSGFNSTVKGRALRLPPA